MPEPPDAQLTRTFCPKRLWLREQPKELELLEELELRLDDEPDEDPDEPDEEPPPNDARAESLDDEPPLDALPELLAPERPSGPTYALALPDTLELPEPDARP